MEGIILHALSGVQPGSRLHEIAIQMMLTSAMETIKKGTDTELLSIVDAFVERSADKVFRGPAGLGTLDIRASKDMMLRKANKRSQAILSKYIEYTDKITDCKNAFENIERMAYVAGFMKKWVPIRVDWLLEYVEKEPGCLVLSREDREKMFDRALKQSRDSMPSGEKSIDAAMDEAVNAH